MFITVTFLIIKRQTIRQKERQQMLQSLLNFIVTL